MSSTPPRLDSVSADTLFELGGVAKLIVRDGTVHEINQAAADLLAGGDRTRLVGHRLNTFLWPMPPADSPTASVESTVQALDDAEIPVDVWRARAADGSEAIVLGDLRDRYALAAERELLQQQLRELQRSELLGNLASGVAHDFNNLLTVIRGHAELLRMSPALEPEDGESLEAILNATDRARGIARQILVYSRRKGPQREEVHLGSLLEELGQMLRASIPSTVELRVENHAGPACLMGDPTELHQLLLNLGTNAEYAMRETGGGTLLYKLDLVPAPATPAPANGWTTDHCLRLRVRDTGTGMSEEVRARIFEPFFTTKPEGEGTGIGLAVLLGIVASHGGTVTVDSQPGAGTTFELHFPALEATLPAAIPTPVSTPAFGVAAVVHQSVLVVDDEPLVAKVTALLLQAAGYRTTVCGSAAEALQRLDQGEAVDLVVTDQTMPGMTGDVLAAKLLERAPRLPVVIATGYSQKLRSGVAPSRNVRRILEKPFLEADLLLAAENALAWDGN